MLRVGFRTNAAGRLLAEWEETLGPVRPQAAAAAAAAFDDLEALAAAVPAVRIRTVRPR